MPPVDQNTGQISEIAEHLKNANNVLITVSNNPSVDQLAACIGLTVALNKKDKHATAVFSGKVPSTLDFLEPDKTIEKDTNSLRDFIISLDKAKADKLRYKVEDSVVKIFITPYKTSITDADLDFSQGDFNVDAVVALGVHDRTELDAAIVAHGRILHDAIIISINTSGGAELGSVNWLGNDASSLSEMTADLVHAIDENVLDSQIATAFLTGIVAETDRFKNEKSSPHTMSVAGTLMEAGASPQLVSTKLEQAIEVPHDESPPDEPESSGQDENPPTSLPKPDDGTIEIDHSDEIHIDEHGQFAKVSEVLKEIDEEAQREKAEEQNEPKPELGPAAAAEPTEEQPQLSGPSMVYEPPTFGGQLTANSTQVDQQYVSSPDPLTAQVPAAGQMLSHSSPYTPPQPSVAPAPEPPKDTANQTLSDLEKSLNSPHAMEYQETPVPSLEPTGPPVPPAEPDYARDAVERAVQASADYRPEPIQALGAQNVGLDMGRNQNSGADSKDEPSSSSPPPPVPPPFVPGT